MSVKRINFTNRRKLTRDHANVVIHPPLEGEGPATFDAQLDLALLRPDADAARVFVEAYHQTTRMRFDFGTVGAVIPPPREQRRLDEFDDWRDVLFRVKVTDVTDTRGRLIGLGDQIKPGNPEENPQLDLVRFKDADLFGLLWDMSFDDHGPVVLIERAAGGANTVGREEPFRAAVYPELLRRTLQKALLEDAVPHDDEAHWFKEWYDGYLHPKLGLSPPPPPDSDGPCREWIDDAVRRFAGHFRLAEYWPADRAEGGAA